MDPVPLRPGATMDRRLLRPALISVAVLVAGLLTPGTAAAHPGTPPPQQQGVTLRVFDVQVPLSEICTLKPAQTPNVDKKKSSVFAGTWQAIGRLDQLKNPGDFFTTDIVGEPIVVVR